MKIFYAFILLFCSSFVRGLNKNISGTIFKKCSMKSYQRPFDVLPGTGWDNLENVEKGRIIDINFSECLFSDDNKYLVPNELSIIPKKNSHVELFSESFDHFVNYTSLTSKSINVNAEGMILGFKLGGSFSYENTQIKSYQLETKSMITRVQMRYTVFQTRFQPDTFLYPTFRNRIMDIAGLLIENKDSLYPKYLADMIIRDYGTHFIRSIDAGAILSKTDALDSKYVKQYQSDSTIIKASASASFLSFFSMSTSFQTRTTNTQINEYNQNCKKTHIDAIGGTLIGSDFKPEIWKKSVLDNLVAIDRRGEPIYYVITPRTLPELDDKTVNQVYNLLKEAVHRYYSRNIRKGCLNIDSPNFNIDANIDEGNCKSTLVNFTMGGVFQTCSGDMGQCPGVSQVNPLTSGYSCPLGFSPVKLHSGLNRCAEHCSGFWFWRKCRTTCSYFETYWCSPSNIGPNHNGYRFGGIISKTMTQCPQGYISLWVGMSVQICVTTDTDPANPYAINFGGFYSCSVGNPLSRYFTKGQNNKLRSSPVVDISLWPHSCAEGYVAHIASIDRGCQISYCTETNKVSLGALPDLVKPPFIELNFNPNSTKVLIFKNKKGETYVKNEHGAWNMAEIKDQHTRILIGSILGSIFFIVIVCLIAVFLQRRYYIRKLLRLSVMHPGYEPLLSRYGSINTKETA